MTYGEELEMGYRTTREKEIDRKAFYDGSVSRYEARKAAQKADAKADAKRETRKADAKADAKREARKRGW